MYDLGANAQTISHHMKKTYQDWTVILLWGKMETLYLIMRSKKSSTVLLLARAIIIQL